MNKKLLLLFLPLVFLFNGRVCAQNTAKKEILPAEFQKHFDQYQVQGSIVEREPAGYYYCDFPGLGLDLNYPGFSGEIEFKR